MAKDKERGPDAADKGANISFRLYEPQAAMLRRLNEATPGKSLHETARTLLVVYLEQQPLHDALRQVEQARAEIDELRKAVTRAAEAILSNLKTELTEQEIHAWCFEKLWPQAK